MIFADVNEDEFELDNEFSKGGVIYREVRLKNRGSRCLNCGTFTTKIKEYRLKKIKHNIYNNIQTYVLFHQRRFICPKCGHTQMEKDPFRSDDNKISDKTICDILDMLKRYNVPFRHVGEYFKLSTRAIIKIFDKYVNIKRNELTNIICIDEVYFSRHRKKKYVLVIINFYNRAILDILKDRDKSTITSYLRKLDFKEKDRVEYVGIDMNDNYRELIPIFFKNATIVADSFHVVKHISKALDDVRKRIMRRYEDDKKSDEYYMLKYRDELLFVEDTLSNEFKEVKRNHHFHYDLSEFNLLEMMLKIDDELRNAYELYHEYIRFNNTDYVDTVKTLDDLNEIINDYKLSGIKEFIEVSNTLNNWKTEIVNSFIKYKGKRVSNGPIEGRNSLIKKIIKIANGYSNFKRFRNRVMYSLNKYASHSFMK
ncbi:MAG: ISL3 family transposase [Firmicutes bacterium]|nr:ISL3 family transposase [Candidatus Colivicinus equi]